MSDHQAPANDYSKQNTSFGLNSSGESTLAPPTFQLKAGPEAPAQMWSGEGMGVHAGIADDYRRWTGMEGEEFDDIAPTEGEIVHGGLLDGVQPMLEPELNARLMDLTLTEARTGSTLLREEYIRDTIIARAGHADLNATWNDIITRAGTDHFAAQMSVLENSVHHVVEQLELAFILDSDTSSIDLLPPEERDRYRDFDWHRLDYPGHAEGEAAGPNEGRARALARDLSDIRPERRANSTDSAVVTRTDFNRDAALRQFIEDELRDIPDFAGAAPDGSTYNQPTGESLNRHAQASFLRMRADALAAGVPLILEDSHRTARQASAGAARSGNSFAVASFSSHTLGLAIDLSMSMGTQNYAETTTRPMQNVVDMRESPIHKWLFVRGASYGWFPYQNEPWHWEYNPEGFRDQFQAEFDASTAAPEEETAPGGE